MKITLIEFSLSSFEFQCEYILFLGLEIIITHLVVIWSCHKRVLTNNTLGHMILCKVIYNKENIKRRTSQWRTFHNRNVWISGSVHIHVDNPSITPVKSKLDEKSEKYYVRVVLCRNSTLENSDMYEFIMAVFYNGEP